MSSQGGGWARHRFGRCEGGMVVADLEQLGLTGGIERQRDQD